MNTSNKIITPQKVLIATGIYPPDIGGPATFSKVLNDELPKYDFDVEVISFGSVRHLPKIIRHIVYFFQILAGGRKADIIFAQDPVSVGLPALIASKILGKKFIMRIPGDYAWEQFASKRSPEVDFISPDDFQDKKFNFLTEFRRKIQIYVAKNSYKIITPSNYLKGIISDGWGIDKDKIRVVYNSFSDTEINISKQEARKKLVIDGKILVSSGRLVSWKGFNILVEVMNDLAKNNPDLKLFILGDGPEKKNIELKIKEYNLENKVILTGVLPKDKLMTYLRSADLFILNTGYEGLSHQLLEVMSVGVPIITTNIGGNLELIEDGKEGILIDYNNKEELKKAIINLLEDKILASRLVRVAKAKVAKFSQGKMLNNLVGELTNIY